MRRLVSRSHIYLLLILLLALGIRLLGISSRPIWYDEAFSILFAEKGPQAMAYGTLSPTGAGSADIHPLEYYTLLWMWMQMFGRSLTAVRLLSVLAGLGNIAFIYLIGRELFDDRLAANPAARAVLDIALYDAMGKALKLPVDRKPPLVPAKLTGLLAAPTVWNPVLRLA